MSIRRKPNEAVPLLVARLQKAKEQVLQGSRTEDEDENDANETQRLSSMFDKIFTELNNMRHVFPQIKSWEKTILDQFCDMEQALDDDIFRDPKKKSQVNDKLGDIEQIINVLKQSISRVDTGIKRTLSTLSFKPKVLPSKGFHHLPVCQEWVDLGIENKILENDAMSKFFASFHCNSLEVQMCSLCLSVFPLNSVIEKKALLYWWIGDSLVMKSQNKTAEDVAKQMFKELLNQGFIRPSSDNKSLSVNSFIVDPWIHRMLILMAEENSFLEFSPEWTPCNGKRRAFLCQGNGSYIMRNGEKEEDLLTVFNVNEQYLRMKPEWLAKLRKVEILQMGRWQNSVTHHIEVEDQNVWDSLGSQKHLKYLSLRGISRIETLPASISKLFSLQILDLRACHNLEKLPPGISRLKNLTHLDVSECYLIESMPKGLGGLLSLQVLTGFVIGKADKNSCKISDLARLTSLRKLSIRVGANQGETEQDDLFGGLDTLPALSFLAISWGNISLAQESSISLPKKLKKLDLQCVPFNAVPEWLWPSKLPPKLEKLYIKGGKLNSLEHKDGDNNWKVKFLRLKYLKNLEIEEAELVRLFPDYLHLEKISCHKSYPDISLTKAA